MTTQLQVKSHNGRVSRICITIPLLPQPPPLIRPLPRTWPKLPATSLTRPPNLRHHTRNLRPRSNKPTTHTTIPNLIRNRLLILLNRPPHHLLHRMDHTCRRRHHSQSLLLRHLNHNASHHRLNWTASLLPSLPTPTVLINPLVMGAHQGTLPLWGRSWSTARCPPSSPQLQLTICELFLLANTGLTWSPPTFTWRSFLS